MNALIQSEFDRLTPYQQFKFSELVSWQSSTQQDKVIMNDMSYFKIIEWVKNLQDPPQEPAIEENAPKAEE